MPNKHDLHERIDVVSCVQKKDVKPYPTLIPFFFYENDAISSCAISRLK